MNDAGPALIQHWVTCLVFAEWSAGTEEMGCMHRLHILVCTCSVLDTDMTTPCNFNTSATLGRSQTALGEHCWCRPTQLYTYTPLHGQSGDYLVPNTSTWPSIQTTLPANTRRCSNVGLTLAHHLRRWPNVSPALG